MDRFRSTAQPDRDWWTALWPDPEGTLRRLGGGGGSLADVCCGNGHFTVSAATLVDHVYAIDIDPDLLADLERLVEASDVEGVEPIEGDARHLPDPLPAPVDIVLVANTFHGVEDQTTFAGAVREALTGGGRFVVVNWHDRPPEETPVLAEPRGPQEALRMPPSATVDAVEPAEFGVVETVDLAPHHYGIVF